MKKLLPLLLIFLLFGCNHYQNKVDLYYDSSTAVGHRYLCAKECGSDSQDFYYSQYLKLLDSNHKYWHLEYGAKAVHPSYKDADPYRCACEPLNPIDGFGANDNDGCENDGPALYRTLDSIAKDSVEIREGDFNIKPGVYRRFNRQSANSINSEDSGSFSGDTTLFYFGDGEKSHIVYKAHVVHTSYLIDDSTGRRVTDSGGRMHVDTVVRKRTKPNLHYY